MRGWLSTVGVGPPIVPSEEVSVYTSWVNTSVEVSFLGFLLKLLMSLLVLEEWAAITFSSNVTQWLFHDFAVDFQGKTLWMMGLCPCKLLSFII